MRGRAGGGTHGTVRARRGGIPGGQASERVRAGRAKRARRVLVAVQSGRRVCTALFFGDIAAVFAGRLDAARCEQLYVRERVCDVCRSVLSRYISRERGRVGG